MSLSTATALSWSNFSRAKRWYVASSAFICATSVVAPLNLRYDGYFDGIGAEDAMGDGEFGGGPWSGEDPYAYGGAD